MIYMIYIIYSNLVSWIIFILVVLIPIIILVYPIGLVGLKEVTRFESFNTFYYKMNPVTKLYLLIIASIIASTTLWQMNALLSSFLLGSFLTLKEGKRKFKLGGYITLVTVLGITWTYAPSLPYFYFKFNKIKPTILWVFPQYFRYLGLRMITLQGTIIGLENSARYVAPFLAALVLIMTSTPSGILRALKKLGVPDEINFAIVVAMRTISKIFDAIDLSVKSQFLKGLGSRGSKSLWPLYVIYALLASFMPSFIYLLKTARNTAIAADTRAFRANPKRTYLNPMVFSKLDYFATAVLTLTIILTGILLYLGYGSPIISFP